MMRLTLDDGTEYVGHGAGANVTVAGEVVFNTAMAGYPESLTDPSYAGQILVLTYPLVGNYGVPSSPASAALRTLQSKRAQVQGLVVQRLAERHSHHAADISLGRWLGNQGIPILSGIDTRSLTRRLRERGTMRGWLSPAQQSIADAQRTALNVDMQSEVFHRVAPTDLVHYEGGDLRVLLVDVGAKDGIVHCLQSRGASVIRAPWHAALQPLANTVDAVMLGNGPGDPSDLDALAAQVRGLLATFRGPIFGICLGHQILARAAGLSTYKLRYGHRGVNQPVREIGTGRCYVTSQNHGYAVDVSQPSPDWEPWFENLNDGTNDVIRWRHRPLFSVQSQPEGRPGPLDTEFLFDNFLTVAGMLRTTRPA